MDICQPEQERGENVEGLRLNPRETQHCRLLALAPNEWNGPWMNRQHLLSRLASAHSILYSCGVWASWERRTADYAKSPLIGRFDICDGVTVDQPGRALLRVPRIRHLDELAIRVACTRWRERLSNDRGPLIAYIFHPQFVPFVKDLKADFLVYHAYDLFRFMEKDSARVEQDENQLLESADLVIATSEETAKDFRSRNDRHIEVLANGVDWSRFVASPRPPDPPELAQIPRPRIGYVGALNEKVDFQLILELARRRRGWQFVIAGPVRNLLPGDEEVLEEFKKCQNIHLIGAVPQHRIPEILLNLDVGLVCYRTLAWTLAGYPLKMLEYLACGLPVVASNLPAVRDFGETIAIAESVDDWEHALSAAVSGKGKGSPALRLAVAKGNSWDMRVARLNILLQRMVGKGAVSRVDDAGAATV